MNLCALDFLHFKNDQPIVDQHRVAHGKIMGQPCIADGNDRLVTVNLPCRKGEQIAVLQHDLLIFKRANAEFRPLGVEHDGNRKVQFLSHLADHVEFLLMLFMRSV